MNQNQSQPFLPENLEEIINWTLPGMAMYYRDSELSQATIQQYKPGTIFRSQSFVDLSFFAGKPTKNCRFIFASSKAAPLYEIDSSTEKWGLHTINYNSIFKVLDVYEVTEDLTQITLWHVPYQARELFRTSSLKAHDLDVEDYIIQKARESLHQKLQKEEIIPALEEPAWIERTAFPVGLDANNTPFAVENPDPLPDELRSLFNAIRKITGDLTELNETN